MVTWKGIEDSEKDWLSWSDEVCRVGQHKKNTIFEYFRIKVNSEKHDSGLNGWSSEISNQ